MTTFINKRWNPKPNGTPCQGRARTNGNPCRNAGAEYRVEEEDEGEEDEE
jgi:hypothetical protein